MDTQEQGNQELTNAEASEDLLKKSADLKHRAAELKKRAAEVQKKMEQIQLAPFKYSNKDPKP